jgi:hypothetical protein
MMKKLHFLLLVMLTLLMLFTASCASNPDSLKSTTTASNTVTDTVLGNETPSLDPMADTGLSSDTSIPPIRYYEVYENGDRYQSSNPLLREPSEFSIAIFNNPIDKKMKEDLKTVDISSTRSAQVFFSEYVYTWQDELSFSLANLKIYLTDEETQKLDDAQTDWENSWKSNNEFDRSLRKNKGIGLGTQVISSNLIYTIDQYRDRVAHIKYMSYLTENYVDDAVPSADQLWNKYHAF